MHAEWVCMKLPAWLVGLKKEEKKKNLKWQKQVKQSLVLKDGNRKGYFRVRRPGRVLVLICSTFSSEDFNDLKHWSSTMISSCNRRTHLWVRVHSTRPFQTGNTCKLTVRAKKHNNKKKQNARVRQLHYSSRKIFGFKDRTHVAILCKFEQNTVIAGQ